MRGPCPDALAVEVHTLTHTYSRRALYVSRHRQALDDMVGEVFAQWLATKADKTEHVAGLHARFQRETDVARLRGSL